MAMNTLDFESEDMQRLVERMARAKWITGTNLITPEVFHFEFTPRGTQQLRSMAELLKRIAPKTLDGPAEKLSWWVGFKLKAHFFFKLAMCGGELRNGWGTWTDGERGALIALVADYAKNKL